MIKIPSAGISQYLLHLQFLKGGETSSVGHFLFEVTMVEHKCCSSTLITALSCYAKFLFLALLQGHLIVKLGNRSHDGFSFALLFLILISRICSALLTIDNIRKNTAPSPALAVSVISIAAKRHEEAGTKKA